MANFWSYDPDDDEIRDERDGSVLFDGHNATAAQGTLAAGAPRLLGAAQAMRFAVEADIANPDLPLELEVQAIAALDTLRDAIKRATA